MFALKSGIALGVFALCVLCAASNDFPFNIEKCHITDTKCQVAVANKLFQTYPHGIPEAGIPDLDPLYLDKISIKGDPKAAANIDLLLTDLKFYKYSRTNITSMSGFTRDTSKNMKLMITAFSPEVIMKAKYKLRGKVLVLPINGDGDIDFVLTGITTKSKYILKPVERNGRIYLNVHDSKIQIKAENIKMNLTNLFNGDPALSKNMLEIINENSQIIVEEIIPYVAAALGEKQGKNANVAIGNVPYDTYFLPDEN